MVTVVKNPQGHKLIDQAIAAAVTNSGGDALITFPYHGMGTGDHVYIDSDIDEYNGFWYVTSIDYQSFKISEYGTADFVPYYQDADIEYYQTNEHEWSSVFLPIVYKISNDRWPVNSVDTARTVSFSSSDNGYLDLTTVGAIKSGIQVYDYVKVSNSPDPDKNGVWQVVEVISDSHIVIDATESGMNLAGATVQFYYNSYQVKVKIYAGLPAGHPWQAHKPYEEMAELSLTPDADNLVMFSISDYLRGKVAIKNNTTLFSLPLNLDAFTGFYISVAEQYDDSDGYAVTTVESSYTDDSFEGYAVTGKLPFKNIYAGDYAAYVYTDGAPANWLTGLTRLLAVEDKYFDISFIKNWDGGFVARVDKYIDGAVNDSEDLVFTDQGHGVYRIPITPNASYDSFCVTIRTLGEATGITLPALTEWATRSTDPALIDWTDGAAPAVSLMGGFATPTFSEYTVVDYDFIDGGVYTLTINYTQSASGGSTSNFRVVVMDDAFTIIDQDTDTFISDGTHDAVLSFTATAASTKVGVRLGVNLQSSATVVINSITGTVTLTDVTFTEEICIDILESCDAATGFIPTDIRLLEDGTYRILE
jgi:hypothetical protein